jgi:hypothetical protein
MIRVTEAGRRRLQQLGEMLEAYQGASEAEAGLRMALTHIESEPAEALASLSAIEQRQLPGLLLRDVALWRRVAEAMMELQGKMGI